MRPGNNSNGLQALQSRVGTEKIEQDSIRTAAPRNQRKLPRTQAEDVASWHRQSQIKPRNTQTGKSKYLSHRAKPCKANSSSSVTRGACRCACRCIRCHTSACLISNSVWLAVQLINSINTCAAVSEGLGGDLIDQYVLLSAAVTCNGSNRTVSGYY